MKTRLFALSAFFISTAVSANSETSTPADVTGYEAHGTVTFSGRVVSDPTEARSNCLNNAIAHNQSGRCYSKSGSMIQSSIQDLNNGQPTRGVRSRLISLDYK